jgi:hypothetical protein
MTENRLNGEIPEFGNLRHISLLKKLDDLKLYEVEIEFTGTTSVQIKAKNLEEAKEIAQEDGINLDDFTDTDISYSGHEISEEEVIKKWEAENEGQ